MNDDRLPVHEPAISEELQQREIDVLQGLMVSGKVDQDRFQRALDELLRPAPMPSSPLWFAAPRLPFNSLEPRGAVKSRWRSPPRWVKFASRAAGR